MLSFCKLIGGSNVSFNISLLAEELKASKSSSYLISQKISNGKKRRSLSDCPILEGVIREVRQLSLEYFREQGEKNSPLEDACINGNVYKVKAMMEGCRLEAIRTKLTDEEGRLRKLIRQVLIVNKGEEGSLERRRYECGMLLLRQVD